MLQQNIRVLVHDSCTYVRVCMAGRVGTRVRAEAVHHVHQTSLKQTCTNQRWVAPFLSRLTL